MVTAVSCATPKAVCWPSVSRKTPRLAEDKIKEINVGVYCFKAKALFETLKKVRMNPKKKEFYLTDVIELLLARGRSVATLTTQDASVAFGVNTREDLARAQGGYPAKDFKQAYVGGSDHCGSSHHLY